RLGREIDGKRITRHHSAHAMGRKYVRHPPTSGVLGVEVLAPRPEQVEWRCGADFSPRCFPPRVVCKPLVLSLPPPPKIRVGDLLAHPRLHEQSDRHTLLYVKHVLIPLLPGRSLPLLCIPMKI